MDSQTLINLIIAAAGSMAGWTLKRLWDSVDHLHDQDMRLAEKVQAIEVLVAGRYVQRHEMAEMELRIITKLDLISEKLDKKVDK